MKKPPAKKQPQNNDNQNEQVVTISTTHGWSGPLPPPAALKEFSEVVPNGAERIFQAWEKETEHRHRYENRDLTIVGIEIILGRLSALLFVLSALGAAVYCAAIGADWVSAILGGGVIASVAWTFIKTQRK